MRRADRQRVVEPEADAIRRIPAELERGQRLALERIEQREIPAEQVDGQFGPLADEADQKLAQGDRPSVTRITVLADQSGAAVEVPADDKDGAPGLQQRGPHGPKERTGVDQNARAIRMVDAPDISARVKDAHPVVCVDPASGSALE